MSTATPESQIIFSSETVVIRRLNVSEMSNNVYLITSKTTGAQVLIDAADDAPAISAMLETAAQQDAPALADGLDAIITTHSHWDHVRALKEVKEFSGATSYASAPDAENIDGPVDQFLAHGDTFVHEDIELSVVLLRGHTPGSIALVYTPKNHPPLIFSGDSLFPGGVGNTWEDPERFASLLTDVEQRLFNVYSDDAAVFPGHGDFTTLGAERPSLPAWRERGW